MPIRLWSEQGDLVWRSNADAWGCCDPDTPSGSIHQPIRLPGQFEDELTGIHYNRFRDYDPTLGRYLTPDPIGLNGGLNNYRYTKNPVDYIDPLGLKDQPTVEATNAHKGEEAPIGEKAPNMSEVETWAQDFAGRSGEMGQAAVDRQAELHESTSGWGNVLYNPAMEFSVEGLRMVGFGVGAVLESALSPEGMSPKVANYWSDQWEGVKELGNLAVDTATGDGEAAADFSVAAAGMGIGRKAPDVSSKTYPDGLAYRTDMPEHLSGPHGFKKNGTLHGTHNQNNAINALSEKGADYELTPTDSEGISELSYKYFNENKGKYVSGRKTVYDPSVYSDQEILDMSQSAGEKAFEMYKSDKTQKVYDVSEGGVNFRAYINIDPKTDAPYIGNVHPVN